MQLGEVKCCKFKIYATTVGNEINTVTIHAILLLFHV